MLTGLSRRVDDTIAERVLGPKRSLFFWGGGFVVTNFEEICQTSGSSTPVSLAAQRVSAESQCGFNKRWFPEAIVSGA